MRRILIINPNSSEACSAGISAAIAPFRLTRGPVVDVVTLKEGPPAIYTWRDWYSVVEPLCRLVERESADIYIIACASDTSNDDPVSPVDNTCAGAQAKHPQVPP